jgi:hypothetical protein
MAANDKNSGRGMAGFAAFLENSDDLARRSTEGSLVSPPASPTPPATAAPQSTPVSTGQESSPPPEPEPQEPAATSIRPMHVVPSEAASPRVAQPKPRRTPKGELPRPVPGREGRLEASGEPVVKWTIELAPQIVHALAIWERDETKRTGQRVFRERLVDIALDLMPGEVEPVIALVKALPEPLRMGKGELFSTRVRSSVRGKLLGLRPDLRVAGIKDVRMRDIYSAGLYRYLVGLGVEIDTIVT